ncbi:MAG: NAD-dependent epimerase/dehydratase family protein, partial [Wenzhouxiangella sp.]
MSQTEPPAPGAAPSPRPVLVLGASGYIGGHLAPRLAAAGRPVRAVARDAAALERS